MITYNSIKKIKKYPIIQQQPIECSKKDALKEISSKKSIFNKKYDLNKFKVYFFLFCILFSVFQPVLAIENSNLPYGIYTMYAYEDPNVYIYYSGRPQPNYEYYYINSSGEKVATYCLDLGAYGPEDKVYDVDANRVIDDPILNSIILNAYPYKSIEELGLKTESQAKFASQFAIWIHLNKLDINLIGANYHASDIDGSMRVVQAIKNIYYAGVSNTDYSITLKPIEESRELIEIDGTTYYKIIMDLSDRKNIIDVKVRCNDRNISIDERDNGNKCEILLDANTVYGNYFVTLNYEVECVENHVLYGQSSLPLFQNMAITIPKKFKTSFEQTLEFEDLSSEVIITKKDATTLDILPGVEFIAYDENMNMIGRYVTDNRGVLRIRVFGKDKIYIKEANTLNGYVLDSGIQEINLTSGKKEEITLLNNKKSGRVVISKKTKEYNELSGLAENSPLSNVSFYILNEKGEIVDDVTTDERGIAITQKLEVGKYYIKEYGTNKYYTLLEELVEFEIVDEGDEIFVSILDDNIEIPKKLPVTGR